MRRVTILLTGAVLLFTSFSISAQDQKKESLVMDGIFFTRNYPATHSGSISPCIERLICYGQKRYGV